MTAVKDIMNVGLSAQALALAGHNIKFTQKKRKTPGDFVKLGMTNIVGTSLLQTQAGFIGGL